MKLPIFVLFILIVIFFSACGPKVVSEQELTFEPRGWAYADSLTSLFNVEDTLKTYDLQLILEHGTEYAYQNCYLFISTGLPDGQQLGKRINIDLANKAGEWYGDCNARKCKLVIDLQSNAFFNQKGNHQFVIKQLMRVDPLGQILKVRFRILETGETRS